MYKRVMSLIAFFPFFVFAQTSNDKLIRAFPITDYIVDLNDSIKIVQVEIEQSGLISEKQVAVLRSVWAAGQIKPDVIGSGRCSIIKGSYYYFAINFKESGVAPREGDLLYVSVAKPSVFLDRLVKLAAHSITLTDVYDNPVYDRTAIFSSWTKNNEQTAMDSMLRDIRFTAEHFLKNEPSMNTKIKSGANQGKLIFPTMMASTAKELNTFLDYIRNHPRQYAGKDWKISEIFATWLTEGSPMR